MARTRTKPKQSVPSRCPEHTPQRGWDMCGSAFDAEERMARGEHQEQCAKCLLWLWEDERGPGFTSTGAKDVD